jgi:ferric-dicitrate binding protein FerR (iron transport regulator)
MPKRPVHIEELIIKYARGEDLSKQEFADLQEWKARSDDHQALPEKFRDLDWLRENLRRLENVPSDRMWDFIRERIALDIQNESRQAPGHLRRLRQWAPYAAAMLLVLAGWLLLDRRVITRHGDELPVPVIARAATGANDNGDHQVLLTLDDGRVLPLDHVPNGKIAESGGLILSKTDSNQLEYTLKPGARETGMGSRITTGRTTPFRLRFPDGTTVQLSHASSLSAVFHEGQRLVTLTGEALFETVKNTHAPFTVFTGKAQIEVLGTVFNVSAYADEPTAVLSLLSGAIKVIYKKGTKVLKPLQQALVSEAQLDIRPLGDSTDVLSWTGKAPYFRFDNADLNTVIRRIARWHQVTIHNPDNIRGIPITGVFRQNESLEAMLGMIDRVESGSAFLKRKGDTIEVSAAVASR